MNGTTRFRVAALVQPAPRRSLSTRALAATALAALFAAGGLFVFPDDALAQDTAPMITVEPDTTPVTEGDQALFTLRRTGPAEDALDVTVVVSTTGSLPFTGDPRTVTLTMDAESAIYSYGLVTENDDRDEADRTVTVMVMAPSDMSYEVGSPSSAMVVVEDDDDLAVEVTTAVVNAGGTAVSEVDEDVGTVTVRVTATTNGSVAPTESVTLFVSSRTDYTGTAPIGVPELEGDVTFQETDWVFQTADATYRAVGELSISIDDDDMEEEGETLRLFTNHASNPPYSIQLPADFVLAIVDNDGPPTYALSVDPASIVEAGGVATVEVSTGGVTPATDQVFELTLGGTATVNADYTIESTTLTLEAGQTEVMATITAVDDAADDDAETIVITASLDGTTVGEAQTITIEDDDAIPGQPANLQATPNGQTAIDLSWSAPSEAANPTITGYRIEWSADGTLDWADLVDDTGSDATTHKDSGLTAGTTRYYRVSALNLVGPGPPSDPASATTDDAIEIQVTTEVIDANGVVVTQVPEHIGEVTVRVTAETDGNVAPAEGVSLFVSSRTDYSGTAPTGVPELEGDATFEATDWAFVMADATYKAVGELSISIDDDDMEEEGETLRLFTNHASNPPYSIQLPADFVLTIVDNDGGPTYALSVDPASIVEAGGVATVEVSAGGVTLATDQVFELTLGGTATVDRDYTIGSTTLTLAAGQTEVMATITAVDDADDDGSETIVITASLDGTTVGEAQTITIEDDDDAMTVPGPPLDLVAVADGPNLILLSWTEPKASVGGAITGYVIEWSPDGTSDWTVLVDDTGSDDSLYPDIGLSPETTRHYRVSAINSAGTGAASETASATTTPGDFEIQVAMAVVDGNGVGVSEVPESVGTATIRLTATTSGSLAPMVGVRVSVASEEDTAVSPADYGALSMHVSFPVTGWSLVQADGNYRAVRDVSFSIVDDPEDEGDRELVDLLLQTAPGTPDHVKLGPGVSLAIVDNDEAPGAPIDFSAAATGPNAIALSWTAPAGGTSPIIGYRIEWSADGTSDWTDLVADTGSDETTDSDSGLELGTTRHYRVSAISEAGRGPESSTASATTTEPPPPPTLPEVTFSGWTPEVIEGEVTTFTLVRSGPVTDALTVSVEVSETGSMISGEAPTSVVFPAGAEHKTLSISTVDDDVDEPDSVITATIAADKEAPYTLGTGVSLQSTVTDNDGPPVVEPPGAPTDLVARTSGSTAIELGWTAPSDEGSSPITGYRIEWSRDGSSDWTELVEDTASAATTYTDDGLEPGTTRHYRVYAVNAVGTGPPSNVARGATAAVETPLPVLPEVTIASGSAAVSEGSDVTFEFRRSGDAALALSVLVEVAETGSTIKGAVPASAIFEAGEIGTILTIQTENDDEEEPDSEITATVVVASDAGYAVGSPSSATVTVKDDDEPAPVVTVPAAPEDLLARAKSRMRVVLNWEAPAETGGSVITGYRIEWSPDGVANWTELADTGPNETVYEDVGLAAGTTRYYRVCAMNSAGAGPVSNVASATTSVQPPEVTIAAVESPVVEGSDVTFTLNRTGSAAESLSVQVEVTETGSRILGSAPTSVVFDSGETRTAVKVRTRDDSADEPASVITATVVPGDEELYVVGTPSSAAVTVDDDDSVPGAPRELVAAAEGETRIRLSWAPPTEAGSVEITGYRVEWSADDASGWVELASTGSTENTYVDSGLAPGTTRYYRVCAMNAVGVGPVSNVAGARTSLPPPEVTIRAGDSPVVEGAAADFVLTRRGDVSGPVAVSVQVAETGSMMNGSAPNSVFFAAGAEAAEFSVPTVDDLLDEPDGEITVKLLEGDGYALADGTSATVKVRDNDAAPLLVLAGASAPESAAELTFEVSLEGHTSMPVQVEWSSSPGTAAADADYVAAGGSLTFEPGVTSGRIVVSVRDDSLYEENETFTVSLSRPRNAGLSDGASSAVGVIEDDDAAPVFRVADATAPESAGELVFTVSLDGESALPATVRWASSAGTAQAGLDYEETNGTLTLDPGTTTARVAVGLIEDLLHEEAETFRVSLSEATNAAFEAGSVAAATGTIEDDDDTAPAEEWLARFGRTAASNAVDAVEDRLTGRLGSGSQVVVAGHRIDVADRGREHGAPGSAAAPVAGLGGIGQAGGAVVGLGESGSGLLDAQPGRYGSGRMDVGDLLARSSFQFSSGSHASGYSNRTTANGAPDGDDTGVHRWSIWGSGAATRFGGGEDGLSLDGEVVSGTVGADIERGRVLLGVAVSHSRGDGDYRRPGVAGLRAREGDLSSDLTTGLPYLRVAVSDRLSVWGALGRGSGSMTLSESGLGSIDADIGMSLGAFGARQELRPSGAADGFSLALRTDLLLVHTTSDETEALPALSTDVNRLRLMLESVRQWRLDSGAALTPSVEVGLRYDDGDAETGAGLELGAGLRYEDGARGLSAEIKGRSLLTHESSGFSEWGVGGSLRFEPGGRERGLSVGLRSTWGAAASGIARLFEEQRNVGSRGFSAAGPAGAAEAEVGYGLPVLRGAGSLTPYFGAGLSRRSGTAWRAGARLRVSEPLGLQIEAARVDRAGPEPSVFQAAVLASLRW